MECSSCLLGSRTGNVGQDDYWQITPPDYPVALHRAFTGNVRVIDPTAWECGLVYRWLSSSPLFGELGAAIPVHNLTTDY